MTMKKAIWWADYRPTKLDEYVSNKELIENAKKWIESKNIPHLLLSGPSGVGKTTFVKVILNELGYTRSEYLWINASQEASIDNLRTVVHQFATTVSFSDTNKLKIIVLDELGTGRDAAFQEALRMVMEEYIDICRFIITTNYLNKITKHIQSRCNTWVIDSIPKEFMITRCETILKEEQIRYDINDVKLIVDQEYPDFRKVLDSLQNNCKDNVLTLNTAERKKTVAHILDAINKKDIKKVRELINAETVDFTKLYSSLFNYYLKTNKLNNANVIGEYSYRNDLVADPEINFLTCVLQLFKVQ